MDENSRKGETVERPVDGPNPRKLDKGTEPFENSNVGVVTFEIKKYNPAGGQPGDNAFDNSGPSSSAYPPPAYENQNDPIGLRNETLDGKPIGPYKITSYDLPRDYPPHVRVQPPIVEEPSRTRRNSIGPPPSYSFVMKQNRKSGKLPACENILNMPPPPTYGAMPRLYVSPDEDRICNLPSFTEPIWRSHSQPALCPRCGIIVLTTTHSHDSMATHVAVLTLCLFGCWPCCLLPYCMNVCKNTYHHCPICQTFLGAYTPW